MNKKFLTLLTSSAITIMVMGTAFAAEKDYGCELPPKKKSRLSEQSLKMLNTEAPEYKVYVARLRFKLILNENPEEKIKKKLRSVLSDSSIESIDSALKPIQELLERDKKVIAEHGPQKGAAQILEELNTVYFEYANQYENPGSSLSAQKENDRYYQKASLGYAFTLPKLLENATNEGRLNKLADIVSSDRFSEKRKAFAQFAIIEQKVKHSLVEPTIPPYRYESETARFDYNSLLENKVMSITTRLSIEYHLVELDHRDIGVVSQNLESIKTEFQRIYDHPDAHSFTRSLSKRYLGEIAKNENKGQTA